MFGVTLGPFPWPATVGMMRLLESLLLLDLAWPVLGISEAVAGQPGPESSKFRFRVCVSERVRYLVIGRHPSGNDFLAFVQVSDVEVLELDVHGPSCQRAPF